MLVTRVGSRLIASPLVFKAQPTYKRTAYCPPAATDHRSTPAGPKQFARSMDLHSHEADKAVSPAAERNKNPILEALQPRLPTSGLVLEVASGSGQHVAHFAAALPHLTFQPSDLTDELFRSIVAYTHGLANVRPPVLLDATAPLSWPIGSHLPLTAILCCNMAHIAPWVATLGLFRGAGAYLAPGGSLFLYGPFNVDGAFTSPSNEAFDASLRARNPDWGIRDVADVEQAARSGGLTNVEVVQMPANNLLLVFKRAA